jgi:hypothetical protein
LKTQRISFEPGLEATIHSHDILIDGRGTAAWTMVTQGLSSVGQSEVAFTIRRPWWPRSFPAGVLKYVPVLKHFASEGNVVRDGDISGYRAPGPFEFGEFVGVAFVTAEAIAGIELPRAALAGVFLTEGELAMAVHCSVRRVLHRLGKEARYFPTPYWSDPSRASVYSTADVEASLLAKFSRAKLEQATATLTGEVMELSLPRSVGPKIAEHLEQGQAIAVVPGRSPGAVAALVWSPGQTEAEAIFAEGARPTAIAATFVGLVPNEAPSDEIRFMEDGYAVVLSSATTARLIETLKSGGALPIGKGESRVLRVVVS